MKHSHAWMGWVMALAFAWPQGGAHGAGITSISNVQNCLDDMETLPADDDLVVTPIAVDGDCMVSEAVIAI